MWAPSVAGRADCEPVSAAETGRGQVHSGATSTEGIPRIPHPGPLSCVIVLEAQGLSLNAEFRVNTGPSTLVFVLRILSDLHSGSARVLGGYVARVWTLREKAREKRV